MANLGYVPIHLEDHDYHKTRRPSARHAESARQPGAHRQCPCCRDNQGPNLKHQPSAPTAGCPQRRRHNVAGSSQPFTAPLQHDGTLTVHNRSVEEYQQIYHSVVDDMLRYNTGRLRPYSLKLGRSLKQKLWERLDRPRIRTSVKKDGLVHVELSYGVGVSPPFYDIDTLGEPEPKNPPTKRPKK